MTTPGHSSLRAAGGGTMSWHEFLCDLKIQWGRILCLWLRGLQPQEGTRRHHPAAAEERRPGEEGQGSSLAVCGLKRCWLCPKIRRLLCYEVGEGWGRRRSPSYSEWTFKGSKGTELEEEKVKLLGGGTHEGCLEPLAPVVLSQRHRYT